MDDLVKNKKRAIRRKRNALAKEVKMNKLYVPKRIEPKRKRKKVTVKEIEEFMDRYGLD